jgi:hypothetical protein
VDDDSAIVPATSTIAKNIALFFLLMMLIYYSILISTKHTYISNTNDSKRFFEDEN